MYNKQILSPELLHKLLRCNFETGKLFWLKRTPEMFTGGKRSPEWCCNIWNARYSGEEAFTTTGADGYKRGYIYRKPLLAHRVIWAMFHGEWPDQIDHINGIKDDNRIVNLREASQFENMKNQKIYVNNTSGVVGVSFNARQGTWAACINHEGKRIYLGSSKSLDEMKALRQEAEIKYGYHSNHGRTNH